MYQKAGEGEKEAQRWREGSGREGKVGTRAIFIYRENSQTDSSK